MSPPEGQPEEAGAAGVRASARGGAEDRLDAVERQLRAVQSEVAELRRTLSAGSAAGDESAPSAHSAYMSDELAGALRRPPANGARVPTGPLADGPTFADRMQSGAAITGVELESLVGRYGTLALAGLVILMGVGAVIKMAVDKGLLTPEVRVLAGVVVATLLAAAGVFFRHRGEVRYGGVLLALSLAVIDLVAWAAGPHFRLVPVVGALGVVDLAAIALASLALADQSEFLFTVSVAGALSAPFVTSDGGGTALRLLLYGAVVLAGALRGARNPAWGRTFATLVLGALVYALAAAALPVSGAWYGPYLVVLFGCACAGAALLFGEDEWKGELPRAYLAVSVVGVLVGWDPVRNRPLVPTLLVCVALGAVTYAALLVRRARVRHWALSAVLLPLVSLGLAYAGAGGGAREAAVFALWAAFSLVAWQFERVTPTDGRSGAHLLSAAILGCLAVTAGLWGTPLAFVAGLAVWGVVVALLSGRDPSVLPLGGVCLAVGAAAISVVDQLASRAAYSYTPFTTRSSASALAAAVGIGAASWALEVGRGGAGRVADRPVRLGVLIGFLIVWGRMELAQAYSRDIASFLLTSYYAGCGVASIVAGRRLGMGRLRVVGLGLSLYAAFKAIVEVTDISSVLLRVGAYAAVAVFLLGAGYLYREERGGRVEQRGTT